MYREGRRRAWRPNPLCVCGHTLLAHDGFKKCSACSPCARFLSQKEAGRRKVAVERLKSKHFDSGLERNVAIDLERQKLAGLVAEIRAHFPLDLFVNGRKICRHYVDFRVVYPDGRVKFIEAKGKKEPTYFFKRNLMEATYLLENPDVEYQVIK